MNKDKDNPLLKAFLENVDIWFENGGFAKRMENFYNYAKKRDISDMLRKLKVRFKYNRKLMNANRFSNKSNSRIVINELKLERKAIKEALTIANNKIYLFFDESNFSFGCIKVKNISKEQFKSKTFHLFSNNKEQDSFVFKKCIERISQAFDNIKLPIEYLDTFKNDDFINSFSKDITLFLRKNGVSVDARMPGYEVPLYTVKKEFSCNPNAFTGILYEYTLSLIKTFLESITRKGE